MNYQLDEIDKNILDFLVENTRMPFTEIAKQMNVSAGTIHVRVKKMEDAGIIKGSSLILDYGKLDYHFIAFMGILLISILLKSVLDSTFFILWFTILFSKTLIWIKGFNKSNFSLEITKQFLISSKDLKFPFICLSL